LSALRTTRGYSQSLGSVHKVLGRSAYLVFGLFCPAVPL